MKNSDVIIKDIDGDMSYDRLSDLEFFARMDVLMGAFLSNRNMMRLCDQDYRFAVDLQNIHHVLVNPEIHRSKHTKLVMDFCKCGKTKATRLIKAHNLLWGDASNKNKEFQKQLIADKILKFAEEAEKEADNVLAAELYEKYYKMMGFDKMEATQTPRALPKLVVLSSDSKLLDVEDIDYEE